jgi:hypothetical protein
LIENTRTLLKACKMREAALVLADEKIKVLTKLVAQSNAKAAVTKGQEKIEQLNSRLASQYTERPVTDLTAKKACTNTLLHSELDHDEWLLAGNNKVFKKAV